MTSLPHLSFLIFELGVYALALVCLVTAWRQGRYLALGLLASIVCSFILETLAIRYLVAEYYYGHFLLTLFCPQTGGILGTCNYPGNCIPLVAPVFEGIILYAAMRTSTRLNLPVLAAPLLDGILALTIEFSLDPIVSVGLACNKATLVAVQADGLGFWYWKLLANEPAWLNPVIFGVPLDNFKGWFVGIVAFSYGLRLAWRWIRPNSRGFWGDVAAALLAVVFTVIVVYIVKFVYTWALYALHSQALLMLLLVGGSGLVTLYFARNTRRNNPIDPVVLATPLLFHLFLLGALFAGRIYRGHSELIGLWVTTFALSSTLFSWPYWQTIFRRSRRRAGREPIAREKLL